MSDILSKININDIDLADERYKISFSRPSHSDISRLACSIRKTGLISPPLVRPLNGKFIIIAGFNRVKALIYNIDTCDKQIIEEQCRAIKIPVYETQPDATDLQCLIKSIACLAFQRPLTHAELVLSATRLHQFMDKNQIVKDSFAFFNRELNLSFVEDLLKIGNLPDPAMELIHSGNLSFKSAKKITFCEKETIEIFISIFSKIKASNNKQLEIIMYIMEIAARDGIKPVDLYKTPEIQNILLDRDKNPGSKTSALRALLYELRFPNIFKAHENFKKKISALKLGNKIKFTAPRDFETQDYCVSFTARNFKEFSDNVQRLNHALENINLKNIFRQ